MNTDTFQNIIKLAINMVQISVKMDTLSCAVLKKKY